MAIEVFNRHENKYLLDQRTYLKVIEALAKHMELDEYNQKDQLYSITNLYYDTNDDYLIQNSLAKPPYKEKLRIRAYGVPELDSKVYVEIKKKYRGIVNKRRCAMTYQEASDFLGSGEIMNLKKTTNVQVVHEIQYLLNQHHLRPKLYLSYDRIAYFDKMDDQLRISFDCNIKTRRFDLDMSLGDYGTSLLAEGNWLMEIKALNQLPDWLIQVLAEYKIYPTSFSKYGCEYQNYLKQNLESRAYTHLSVTSGSNQVFAYEQEQRKEEIKCLNQFLRLVQPK